jgi:UDP-N-acetylmuramyl tripeptide synthase
VFREIARVAASQADAVVLKDSHKYLRGRQMGDMPALMREGIREAGRDIPVQEADSEREASLEAFERVGKGDVVVLMCIEDYDYLIPWLEEHGRAIS